jgi:putative flippase GtrA
MDYGFYFLLSYIFGVQYLIAAIAGFIAGTSTNYLISKYMVFQGEPQSRSVEVFLVFLISGIGLLWLELGLYLLTDIYGMHYLLSKLVMTAVVFLWNFFARKFFMYSKFHNILKER